LGDLGSGESRSSLIPLFGTKCHLFREKRSQDRWNEGGLYANDSLVVEKFFKTMDFSYM
jgi:hypothetical protein